MARGCTCVLLAFALSTASLGIINPRFTPRHLVDQADLVLAGLTEATDDPLEWRVVAVAAIKGKAAGSFAISLAECSRDHVGDIQQVLKANARGPAILFTGTLRGEKRACLHAAGLWFDLKAAGDGRWGLAGYAPQLSGTYAGGTDMLIRTARLLAEAPDITVPVTAGVRWMAHAKAGNVSGEVAGLAAIEFPAVQKACLFVGSTAGDRLFRAKGDDAAEEITASTGLDTKSRRFAWVDADGDGLADLVSWDGSAAAVRLAGPDGRFRRAAAAPDLGTDCLAIAPCSIDGRPGLLVSTTTAAPFLVVAAPKGEWTRCSLPPAGVQAGLGRPSACVVADLDSDGFVDILQPRVTASLLWRGKTGGFLPPSRCPVATGDGGAIATVGDFSQDGHLDVFLAGPQQNGLWENDGNGSLREVIRHSGSMSSKCPAGAADAKVMDLNHDGHQDLCFTYPESRMLYHWNRGFRSFAEESEVRLPIEPAEGGQPHLGPLFLAAADLNGDGSVDLATLLTNGDLLLCFNEQTGIPGLRLRLPKGVTGPVTASVWVGDKSRECLGALPILGHSPATFLCTRDPGKCTVRFRCPGGAKQEVAVAVEDAPKDFILSDAAR